MAKKKPEKAEFVKHEECAICRDLPTQCTAKRTTCRKCEMRFTEEHSNLWFCQRCDEHRHCHKNAVEGYNVCGSHGAGSPKKGRPGGKPTSVGWFSKDLPKELTAHYEELLHDPELLALRNEMSALAVREKQLMRNIEWGQSRPLLAHLREIVVDLIEANQESDNDRVKELYQQMIQLIQKGGEEEDIWKSLQKVMEQRRKLSETERRRLVDLQQMIPIEKLRSLILAIRDIVMRHVKEPTSRAAIAYDFGRLLSDRAAPLRVGDGGADSGSDDNPPIEAA